MHCVVLGIRGRSQALKRKDIVRYGYNMTNNTTYVYVTNMAELEYNTTLTNYLLIMIIFMWFALLFFRNVSRPQGKRGKK